VTIRCKEVFLRRDHRPYVIKKLHTDLQRLYVNHFLRPQLESLGEGFSFLKPWYVRIHGSPIAIGGYANVVGASDGRVRLTVWPGGRGESRITIGDYCLICPGVRISAAAEVVVGDNCMLANGVYLTDSDWHGIYDRTVTGNPDPVRIENNAWIGDSAIVCKGVTVGENSIVGAGAVVTHDVPANSIAAGNPAKVMKRLDPSRAITQRSQWFSNPDQLFDYFDFLDRDALEENTVSHWLRTAFFPAAGD